MIYKEFSHQNIQDIKRGQKKHGKDIIQPRDREGNLSEAYLKEYGAKNIRITTNDISTMARKNLKFAKKLQQHYEYRNNQKS